METNNNKNARYPELEKPHLMAADKIVCVSDPCTDDLKSIFPDLAGRIVTIENLVDGGFIRQRARLEPEASSFYEQWKNTKD